MTTRALIVDDEPLARDCIRLALAGAHDLEVVAECGDGPTAVAAIRADAPDLVFLDVQMPGLGGFDVIEEIGPERMPPVIFVTAYDAHAIRAFEVHALDYVLKPFDDARLRHAVEHARRQLRMQRVEMLREQMRAVLLEWRSPAAASPPLPTSARPRSREAVARGAISRFAVRKEGRVRFVKATDIDWIGADGNYLVLHTSTEEHRIRAAIRQVADELDPTRFVRIHRSVIVNIERIREVQPWFGGDYIAILRDGTKLRVSRARAPTLLKPMA